MPKIECVWISCRYNDGEYNPRDYTKNDNSGECIHDGVIELKNGFTCSECGEEVDLLSCESYEPKVYDFKTGKRCI